MKEILRSDIVSLVAIFFSYLGDSKYITSYKVKTALIYNTEIGYRRGYKLMKRHNMIKGDTGILMDI